MYRSSLLPVGLIVLVLSSLAHTANPTTPLDPFHHIAKLAQRPPDPPVCCLSPLPSSEPAEEILSFEEWKTKQEQALLRQQQEQPDRSKSRDASVKETERSAFPKFQQDEQNEAHSADDPPPLEPPSPPPPHFRVPLTDRFNYASLDCSARVHYAHRSARSSSSLLSSKKDKYMLSPCDTPGEDKFVIVELCEDIRIDTVQLANFEFFSGVFKDFSVSVARTYTTDSEGWTPAGTYRAKNIRGIQFFHPPTSLRDFYRFIRIDFHSHYGNEYYCPISLLRVYGLTHLEQWKWEVWEAEYQAKLANAAPVRSIAATSEAVAEDSVRVVKKASDGSESSSTGVELSPGPRSELSVTADTTMSPTESKTSPSAEATVSNATPETITTESAVVNEVPKSTEEPSQPPQSENSQSAVSFDPLASSKSDAPDLSSPPFPSRSDSTIPSQISSQPYPSASLNFSTSSQSLEPSSLDSNQMLNATSSTMVFSTPVTTIVPHESRPVPATGPAGESIYRTIMTRLSILEQNSTLYLRYVEEQTRSLRDALTRLEEDVGRLEGLNKATTQSFQKTINEMDRQRRRLEREHGELQTRLDYLTDEVILEKRLGIAQLCLLLTVLVFMALTRGSRGESFVAPTSIGRRDSLREWGRRHLSSLSSGEWASKLRTGSPTPVPEDFVKSPIPVKNAGIIKFPTQRRQDGDRTPQRSSTNLTAPTSVKGRSIADIRTPHPRQFAHRPRTPTSASFAVYAGQRSAGLLGVSNSSTTGQGASRPRLRRASSHTAPALVAHSLSMRESIAPAPLSAKKWAKTAHLHEIRKGGLKTGAGESVESGVATTIKPPIRTVYDNENSQETGKVDGGSKPSMPSLPTGSATQDKPNDQVREGSRPSESRKPLSVSPLQNRIQRAELDRLCLEQASRGPRIIDLDTESDSWVDTDVEGSEADEKSP